VVCGAPCLASIVVRSERGSNVTKRPSSQISVAWQQINSDVARVVMSTIRLRLKSAGQEPWLECAASSRSAAYRMFCCTQIHRGYSLVLPIR
jgi:hypothetical protein